MTGFSPEEMVGRSAEVVLDPDGWKSFETEWRLPAAWEASRASGQSCAPTVAAPSCGRRRGGPSSMEEFDRLIASTSGSHRGEWMLVAASGEVVCVTVHVTLLSGGSGDVVVARIVPP